MIGGAVSTNAGGAATFKYGTTRDWVDGLRVVLTDGAILAVDRGQCLAAPGERFDIERSDGTPLPLIAPTYSLPALKKISAGYHVSDPLDLVDLFVGSEGTLGMIAEIRLRLQPLPAGVASAIVFHDDEDEALDFAAELTTGGGARPKPTGSGRSGYSFNRVAGSPLPGSGAGTWG